MTDSEGDAPTVLVVDDDSDLADLYTKHLETEYDVRTAYGGDEALELFDDSVDVVLLDRRMPGLSGDEVLERITERGYDGGVIMLTAISPDYDVIDMGFDEYLVKPITLPELSESVARIVALNDDEAGPQRLYALLSKRYTLEMRKGAAELREDDRYLGLLDEVEELEAELDPDVAKRIDAEASSAAFGSLDGETIGTPDFEEIDMEAERSAGSGGGGGADRAIGGAAADALLDHVSDPIFLVDGDRRIVDCNEAFVQRFGYARSELEGEAASMLYVGRADDGDEGGVAGGARGSGEVIDYRTNDGSVVRARTTVVSLEATGDAGPRRAAVLHVDDGAGVGSTEEAEPAAPDLAEELDVATSLLRHEIGNDLNLVTGYLGQLQTEVDEAHHDEFERLQRRLSETATKVEEFSEYLTLAGAAGLGETEPVALAPAVERAVERVRPIDADARIEVADLGSPEVQANDLLEVVVRNLLDNAVRHHEGDEPHVTVDAEVEGDTVRLRVADDGPGIPESIRSTLTEPSSKTPESTGLGLGLYLVDRLVEAYGGSLELEDRDPTGTVAVIELVRAE